MANKYFIIFCGFCGFKETAENLDKFTIVPGCTSCDGHKVKCNKCGRPVVVQTHN